jgi:hypothetical protein
VFIKLQHPDPFSLYRHSGAEAMSPNLGPDDKAIKMILLQFQQIGT